MEWNRLYNLSIFLWKSKQRYSVISEKYFAYISFLLENTKNTIEDSQRVFERMKSGFWKSENLIIFKCFMNFPQIFTPMHKRRRRNLSFRRFHNIFSIYVDMFSMLLSTHRHFSKHFFLKESIEESASNYRKRLSMMKKIPIFTSFCSRMKWGLGAPFSAVIQNWFEEREVLK